MTPFQYENARPVEGWLGRLPADLPAASLLLAFERAFAAVWSRACPILGEISLHAIADHVLRSTAAGHPALEAVRVEPSGFSFKGLRPRSGSRDKDELRRALGALLAEFLSTIDELTAGVLTSGLVAQLDATPPVLRRGAGRRPGRRRH